MYYCINLLIQIYYTLELFRLSTIPQGEKLVSGVEKPPHLYI